MLRVSEGNLSPLGAADGSQVPNRSSDSHMAMTVASTDTTVNRLYTQYQTHILNPINPGILLTVPTRESLLYPKPLRVQSIRAEGKHMSLHSGIAVSATGMTTDSEEDPFRYDKDAYNIFLHPSKERDVSAALNHISGLSSHSRATLCRHGAVGSREGAKITGSSVADVSDDNSFRNAPFDDSTESSYRNSRLKKRRTVPKDLTMQSAMSSTTGGGTWATIFPFGSTSTSTRYGGPSSMLKSAATRLHLDDLARRLQQRRKPGFAVGSGLTSLSSTPRLYPWDYQAHRRQRARGTDPELRAIALAESDGERQRNHGHDIERNGVPLDPEAFISHEGRRRRKTWFYCMLAVSMFPFISVMVYLGKFDSGLSWYSRGEVDRLNTRQRRVILVVTVAQFVLWPIILGLVIWRTQQLANTN
ncbi:hypothetical protein SCUCBS95973_004588 [Sporothrix curviconia]|uniref:Uncharacterized protein n=1 Tax=Sporothrix curviconia TaxID=1260050 RepID=A0ABP0BR91_9PEZI